MALSLASCLSLQSHSLSLAFSPWLPPFPAGQLSVRPNVPDFALDSFLAVCSADTLEAGALLLLLARVRAVHLATLHALHRPAVLRIRTVVDIPGRRSRNGLERVRSCPPAHSGVVGLAGDFADGIGLEAGFRRGGSRRVCLGVERGYCVFAPLVAGLDLFPR